MGPQSGMQPSSLTLLLLDIAFLPLGSPSSRVLPLALGWPAPAQLTLLPLPPYLPPSFFPPSSPSSSLNSLFFFFSSLSFPSPLLSPFLPPLSFKLVAVCSLRFPPAFLEIVVSRLVEEASLKYKGKASVELPVLRGCLPCHVRLVYARSNTSATNPARVPGWVSHSNRILLGRLGGTLSFC